MSALIQIGDGEYDSADPDFEAVLAYAHARKLRPLCLCTEDGAALYVAHVYGRHVLKRMPGTAGRHAVQCPHSETHDELSGLVALKGGAIREVGDESSTILALGFPFKKGALRKAPLQTGEESDTTKVTKSKLSLLDFLHYLWGHSGLTSWSSAFEGRRSWATVYNLLNKSLAGLRTKGEPLCDHVFLPEPFFSERAEEIKRRRRRALAKLQTVGAPAARPLMILIGELKEMDASQYGEQLIIRHLAERPIYLSSPDALKLTDHYAETFGLWKEPGVSRRVVAAILFSIPPSGHVQMEEAALMLTDQNWIPIGDSCDLELLDALYAARRAFTKPTRFRVPRNRPVAAAILDDTAPRPTALYIERPGLDDTYRAAFDELVTRHSGSYTFWSWTSTQDMQPFPAKSARHSRTAEVPGVFLEVGEGEEHRLVRLGRPFPRSRGGGGPEMAAKPQEVLKIVSMPSSEARKLGARSDIAADEAGRLYHRLSEGEVRQFLPKVIQSSAAPECTEPVEASSPPT